MSEDKSILQRAIETANNNSEVWGEKPYDIIAYSGRFMYGRRCLGVRLENDAFGRLMADIAQYSAEIINNGKDDDTGYTAREVRDFYEELSALRWDSLGLGMIVYFKDTQFVESEDEADTDDEEDEDTDE